MGNKSFSDLTWLARFLDQTPGDEQEGGPSRQVPGVCWSRVKPTPTPNPTLRLWSEEIGDKIGIKKQGDSILGGSELVDGMDPYAQRYGGHQFGNWARQLGDGRAITLGEVDTGNEVIELQLKGSGSTPYSRFSDGKAVLRSSIREFLCSEAMFHLGVPTTRALSLVTTGEDVIRDIMYDGRPAPEPGAIVCRTAPSFIRFGSFQIHTMTGDHETLQTLAEYTVKHHFPKHNLDSDVAIINWLKQIGEETALMIAHWMRVGFVHGVMNTDNMSIHGLTIDYGPYGWLEDFNPDWTPNTTDAGRKRYRYGNQPQIGAWNYARLLEAIGPLLEDPEKLYQALENYYEKFESYNNKMWSQKLGLDEFRKDDEDLVKELTSILGKVETDMTIFFRLLSAIEEPNISSLENAFYDYQSAPKEEWNAWLNSWWERVDGSPDRTSMKRANPKYVLRNWMAQLAIDAAEKEDYSVCEELFELLKNPYDEQPEFEEKWFKTRPEWARNRVGCSMLSCSS
ncbi:MAG: YdiU family protein [Candidatus Thermoplasmatota archaeon]|nr:YdiU family protein [Candidatus Thermoplasmatota archaeon]